MSELKEIHVKVTEEDVQAAMLTDTTGPEILERAIHANLDRQGVPRDGRTVTVTREDIDVRLPAGWNLAD